jgi:hypothetical protein
MEVESMSEEDGEERGDCESREECGKKKNGDENGG